MDKSADLIDTNDAPPSKGLNWSLASSIRNARQQKIAGVRKLMSEGCDDTGDGGGGDGSDGGGGDGGGGDGGGGDGGGDD